MNHEVLINILLEFGLDYKSLAIIKQTLDTYSQVKFMGDVSKPFKIKMDLRQGENLTIPVQLHSGKAH